MSRIYPTVRNPRHFRFTVGTILLCASVAPSVTRGFQIFHDPVPVVANRLTSLYQILKSGTTRPAKTPVQILLPGFGIVLAHGLAEGIQAPRIFGELVVGTC